MHEAHRSRCDRSAERTRRDSGGLCRWAGPHRTFQVLPAVIAECQHGFVYGRVQYENILKVIDACEWADMAADAKHYREHPGDVPAGLDPSLLMGDIDGRDDEIVMR